MVKASAFTAQVHVGGGLSGTIPMRDADALEALTLSLADDVKMLTPRTQNMNLQSSLIAAWDLSQEWDIPINPA